VPEWNPKEGIEKLLGDGHMLAWGVLLQLFIGVLCTATTYIASIKSLGTTMIEPWLRIPSVKTHDDLLAS